MKKENNPDFIYQGTFEFDPSFCPFKPVEIEKKRYKAISKQIRELRDEISGKKKEENVNEKEIFDFFFKKKSSHRTIKFQYKKGEVYPKEISFPNLVFIQFAEPHVLITDLYDQEKEWYIMPSLIKGFAEEAYLSYEMGFWFSSIASAINCCEYILKYEYFRNVNQVDKIKAEKLSKDKNLSLGTFTHKNNTYLEEINIKSKFHSKIDYLNSVRISIYHFSPEKAKKANEKGNLEIEKLASVFDNMVIPIIAFRVYSIMEELIDHFYNKKKALEYTKEGVKDWMKKRKLKEEDIKK